MKSILALLKTCKEINARVPTIDSEIKQLV